MVVPATRIIPSDHDGSFRPRGELLQAVDEVDEVDDELLLQQWIRVSRIAVLVGQSLDKAHGGHIVGIGRGT